MNRYRYGRSDVNEISIGLSLWNMLYRYGLWYIDMVIYHIDMVILDIDMGYGLMMWEITVSYDHPGYRYGTSCHSGQANLIATSSNAL
jgi:hypothetical protein